MGLIYQEVRMIRIPKQQSARKNRKLIFHSHEQQKWKIHENTLNKRCRRTV